MTDQTSQYYAILTAVGEAKQANANALGVPWTFSQMGVGDANLTDPIPSRDQITLINERRRAPLNQVKVAPDNASIIVAEQVIPPDVGGWWIREIGLYDADGDLVAVANCAPSFKPLLSQGTGKTQVVRLNIIVTSTAIVQLKVDPAVVLATREYVDSEILSAINKLDFKPSVRAATTANIVLSGLQTLDSIVLSAGDRVLVKNQTTASQNGIYSVSTGSWLRAPDADQGVEVTSGLIVAVEQGATLADTRWQLITDAAIVLGTTPLVFQNVTSGFAPLVSPALTGTPTVPTAAAGTNTTQAASTAHVRTAVAGVLSKSVAGGATVNLTAAEAGNAMLSLTGALTANIAVTVPAVSGWWVIDNRTTGAFTLTLKTPAGTGVVVLQGKKRMVWCDGVNVMTAMDDLDSIALTGVPTVATPALFDTSTRIANMAALQARGNQLSGFAMFSGARVGVVSDIGGAVHCTGVGANSYSLPNATAIGLPAGASVRVQNWGVSNLSLTVQGADKMQETVDGTWSATARSIPPDSYVDCIYVGSNMWVLTGPGVYGKTRSFAAGLGVSGWQKLPSGLILQWTRYTFPAAAQNVSIGLPIAYPTTHIAAWGTTTDSAIYGASATPFVAAMPYGLSAVLTQSNYTASQSGIQILSIGF